MTKDIKQIKRLTLEMVDWLTEKQNTSFYFHVCLVFQEVNKSKELSIL